MTLKIPAHIKGLSPLIPVQFTYTQYGEDHTIIRSRDRLHHYSNGRDFKTSREINPIDLAHWLDGELEDGNYHGLCGAHYDLYRMLTLFFSDQTVARIIQVIAEEGGLFCDGEPRFDVIGEALLKEFPALGKYQPAPVMVALPEGVSVEAIRTIVQDLFEQERNRLLQELTSQLR